MAEKSLDDQLKEIQIAREQAELEKVKEETALVRKQVNAKWYSGRSLGQITAVALTVVALYSAVDQLFLKDIKQKEARLAKVEAGLFQWQVDSLNREKIKIITTIDSLKIRAIISAVFGNLDSLEYANVLTQYKMIKTNKYFDRRLNPEGGGVENDFEVRVVRGDTVIYDAATKLTWQGGSEFSRMDWIKAKAYVDNLSYAGHGDWRLPTLEEVMSLMESNPIENELHGAPFNELHVDARFKDTPDIWTADMYDASLVWSVFFFSGRCELSHANFNDFVRAVR